MELFPAADEEQFEFIKSVIDQSDYYVLITAGRYGSLHPTTGLSYTEMEYDYALQSGKPIIRLLHKNPFNDLRGEFIEQCDEQREKLERFRQKLTASRLVRYWESPSELMAETVFALQDIQSRKPAVGWARATEVSTTEAKLEISQLREENRLLRETIAGHEGKDFKPVLEGLRGEIELQKYCFSRPSHQQDDPFGLGRQEDEIELRGSFQKFLFKKNGEATKKPINWVIERLSYGFLFGEGFETAVMHGLSSAHSFEDPESFLYRFVNENSIQPYFMTCEGAGLFRPGERYSGLSAAMKRYSNQYLRGTPWSLGDEYRNWLVKQKLSALEA